ncbi:outer membrane protein [Polynucleobacter paneuropaeus]|uniref:outer membrane protein n=1 Tax=Polynucleobacter paneuropaeus TaxID=2527775 RepID=UPI001BFE736B|nr:outer membrane beta-barrel protein [Polynucleobacter paneuropaeus]MBT8635499.1 outer membrane beta-barrel protein [Polynucleobacter paneuropaeus]QWD52157.1 outer membrane beta-barrel protein [Polynucleobacter paneuropaeus]QWD55475.1 outer membrane beta-barrel protein [Polynucleobacter paneuropaeus]QWD57076.1 outer membrane beta-barrel protein [Polynucleobacter paneuropaeus]
MKIKLLVAAAATVVASSAMAQSAFEGFYGQIATGYESNTMTNLGAPYTVTWSGGSSTGNSTVSNQTASGMPLVIGLGYTFAVTGPWLVGFGADYSALSQKTGSYSSTISGGSTTGNQIEISNRYNIYVTPSYAIDKDKLVYLKAGYSSMQSKFTSPAQGTDYAASNTTNPNGYILGLGYKQMITSGLYGFAEGNYMSYSNTSSTLTVNGYNNGAYTTKAATNGGSNAYTLLVGVGYKF